MSLEKKACKSLFGSNAVREKHESEVTRRILQNPAVAFCASQRVSNVNDSESWTNREARDSGNSGVLKKSWPPVPYQSLSMVGAAGNSSESKWDETVAEMEDSPVRRGKGTQGTQGLPSTSFNRPSFPVMARP